MIRATRAFLGRPIAGSGHGVDGRTKHDLKWVGIWGAATIIFALIGGIGRNGWWIGALITGTFFTIYGIAKFDEWRDRRALARRDDADDS